MQSRPAQKPVGSCAAVFVRRFWLCGLCRQTILTNPPRQRGASMALKNGEPGGVRRFAWQAHWSQTGSLHVNCKQTCSAQSSILPPDGRASPSILLWTALNLGLMPSIPGKVGFIDRDLHWPTPARSDSCARDASGPPDRAEAFDGCGIATRAGVWPPGSVTSQFDAGRTKVMTRFSLNSIRGHCRRGINDAGSQFRSRAK